MSGRGSELSGHRSSRYLSTNASSHRGVLLTLSEWQPNRKPAAEEAGAEPEQEPDESTG